MKKHIKLARDMGLNWQAALIEDAQSDIKAVIRDAVMRGWTWEQTNDAIVQIVDETVDELESETLKVKARVSLLRYATEQYRRMKDAIPESFFPLFFAAKKIRESKSGNAKAETIKLARQIVRQDPDSAAAKTIQSVLDQVSGKATAQITKAEYVEIAQPTQRYMRDYMADVEQAFAELATSDAKDGYGSSVSLRNIAEMTVRYEKNMAQLKELRDSGTRLVWISAHANCSTRCQPWQGRLYSLDGSSGQVGGKTYIPLDRAMNVPYTTKAGKTYQNGCISGYNCRHYLIPYESGVRPVEESAEVVDKYREINERQRNFERDIRHAKELAATYREINPKLAQWYDRQAKKLYEKYKEYSEMNDVAYYPDRTDIFPKS